jgi:hypothetical protein
LAVWIFNPVNLAGLNRVTVDTLFIFFEI